MEKCWLLVKNDGFGSRGGTKHEAFHGKEKAKEALKAFMDEWDGNGAIGDGPKVAMMKTYAESDGMRFVLYPYIYEEDEISAYIEEVPFGD